MQVKEYYSDIHKLQRELEEEFESGEIFLTSVFNRDKNSVAGCVSTASPENAARVIVDGTHRLSTDDEVKEYKKMLEDNRVAIAKAEQQKKQQYIVVVDQKADNASAVLEQ